MFDFDLEKSWDAVQEALEYATDASCEDGVAELSRLWRRNKEGLRALFPENGRVEAELDASATAHNLIDAAFGGWRGAEDAVNSMFYSVLCRRVRQVLERLVADRDPGVGEKFLDSMLEAVDKAGVSGIDGLKNVYSSGLWEQTAEIAARTYVNQVRSQAIYNRMWGAYAVLMLFGSPDVYGYHTGVAPLTDIPLTPEELCSGRLRKDRIVPASEEHGTKEQKFQAGTKLGKYAIAVARYCGYYDEEAEAVATALSQIISELAQQPRMRVVLSINPLDMLYASYHTTGWRSCHNFIDGEWRTGPISYMIDSCSAIAYCYKTVRKDDITGLELPVKIWRQMVFFDLERGSAIFSRQYPQRMPAVEKAVRRLAAHLLAKAFGVEGEPLWKYTDLDGKCGHLLDHSESEDERSDSSSRYAVYRNGPVWAYLDNPSSGIRLVLPDMPNNHAEVYPSSGCIPCVVCGETRDRDTDDAHSSLLCINCGSNYGRCAVCGGRINFDRDYYVEIGTSCICEDCVDNSGEVGRCYHCEEYFWRSDMYEGPDEELYCEDCFYDLFVTCSDCGEYVATDDAYYVQSRDYYVCPKCYEREYTDCYYCNEIVHVEDAMKTPDGDLCCEECYSERFVECSCCGAVLCNDEAYEENGKIYCDKCYNEMFADCVGCGEVIPRIDANLVDDEPYCDRCYEELFAGEECVSA